MSAVRAETFETDLAPDEVRPVKDSPVESHGERSNVAVVLPEITALERGLVRLIDVIGSAVALVVIAPFCVIAALAVRMTSHGPAIFRQQRVGKGGELIDVLKFRTMTVGTHEDVLANPELRKQYEENDFKLSSDDPSITRIGRVLRKSSLDELPQFLNVLRGEMSLVGIRPLLPLEVARRSLGDQDAYRLLKPGVTGLWQVEGRSAIGDRHRIELDRSYVEDWSLGFMIRILIRTPKAVLVGAGAH